MKSIELVQENGKWVVLSHFEGYTRVASYKKLGNALRLLNALAKIWPTGIVPEKLHFQS